ncbi:MAG: tRNA lysidine(34) synthetase TilS, partial [Proteobacteria bacterium]|nr:tRNA lysidine(34) synthetase TilS [Pseudomonadota bacterium]
MFSPDNLLSCLTQFPIQHIYLGYSGGLDSHVLLHALHDLKQRYSLPPITAIHINHGLSPHAHEWESHCEGVCEKLKIPFQSFSIKISEDKSQSLEEKAREARYQIFSELMKPNDALLTAHQKNDQAETVLYRLFRGTGLKGLSGMSVAMPYVTGYLLRPLLPYTRQELEVYATTHELQWIEDESNTNTRFDRNFIRHSVLPLLKTRWTEVENHLTRVADFSTEAQILLEDLADQDKKFCEGSVSNTLSIQKLLTLTPERQNNVLRYWFQTFDIALPSQRKLQHIMTDVIHSRADAMPEVIWGTSCVR